MLYLLVIWMGLGICSWLIGTAILRYCNPQSLLKNSLTSHPIVPLWLGLIGLSLIFLTISLGFPLSLGIGIGVTGGLGFWAGRTNPWLGPSFKSIRSARVLVPGAGIGLAAAYIVAQPITWLDSGLYHLGTIRWLADYGTVIGAALIHSRFGFGSSWFALVAPFNSNWVNYQAAALGNGLVLIWVGLHLMISWQHCFRYPSTSQIADWFALVFNMLLLPCLLIPQYDGRENLLSKILISPSPDIPILVLVGIIAWLLLTLTTSTPGLAPSSTIEVNGNRDTRFSPSSDRSLSTLDWIPLVLASGAVAIKLTGFPLLAVVSVFYLKRRPLRVLSLIQWLGWVVLPLAPVLVYGILTSGCPLYPIQICLDLPWALSRQTAVQEAQWIQGWSTWIAASLQQSGVQFWDLVQGWLQINAFNWILLGLLIVSAILGFSLVRLGLKHKAWLSYRWVVGLALVGVGFILVYAPLHRFGLGYFLLIPSLVLALICQHLVNHYGHHDSSIQNRLKVTLVFRSLQWGMMAWIGISCSFALLAPNLGFHGLLPPPLIQPTLVQQQSQDVTYYYPTEPQADPRSQNLCWAAAPPCALGPLSGIQLRDPEQGLGAGLIKVNPDNIE